MELLVEALPAVGGQLDVVAQHGRHQAGQDDRGRGQDVHLFFFWVGLGWLAAWIYPGDVMPRVGGRGSKAVRTVVRQQTITRFKVGEKRRCDAMRCDAMLRSSFDSSDRL